MWNRSMLLLLTLLASTAAQARCPTLSDLSWEMTPTGSSYEASFRLTVYGEVFWGFNGTVDGSTISLDAWFTHQQLPPPATVRFTTLELPPGDYQLVLQGFQAGYPTDYCPAQTRSLRVGTPQAQPVDALGGIGTALLALLALCLALRHRPRPG